MEFITFYVLLQYGRLLVISEIAAMVFLNRTSGIRCNIMMLFFFSTPPFITFHGFDSISTVMTNLVVGNYVEEDSKEVRPLGFCERVC